MHVQGFAESNVQKLSRACGQLSKVTPDHSAPLIVNWTLKHGAEPLNWNLNWNLELDPGRRTRLRT